MFATIAISKLQIITVAGSLIFLMFILEAVRRQRLKEAYSLLWLVFGGVFVILASWHQALGLISKLVGIAYAPATLFLFLIIAAYLILIQYSIILSNRAEQIKNLTQELGLLSSKVEKLEKQQQKASQGENA